MKLKRKIATVVIDPLEQWEIIKETQPKKKQVEAASSTSSGNPPAKGGSEKQA